MNVLITITFLEILSYALFCIIERDYHAIYNNSIYEFCAIPSRLTKTPNDQDQIKYSSVNAYSSEKNEEMKNIIQSSEPFDYSDIHNEFYPDFSTEHSFIVYEQRIAKTVQQYVNREVSCFRKKKKNCLSFNKAKKPVVSKPYNASLLSVEYIKGFPSVIESTICNTHPIRVIVGIPISPSQFNERRAIRHTWCSQSSIKDSQVQCIFFCGMSEEEKVNQFVQEESQQYNDIVQFGFQNSYVNLTLLQLYSYNWAVQNCSSFSFYIRADTDIFLNMRAILETIIPTPKTQFAFGHKYANNRPIRNPESKWYLPTSVYPYETFPPYIQGCMYIWSKDIVETVLSAAEFLRPLHYMDDVYYGQVFKYYNISITSEQRRVSPFQKPLSFDLWKNMISVHRYSPIDLLTIWQIYSYYYLY